MKINREQKQYLMTNLQLIDTVNKNFHHIAELNSLEKLFFTTSQLCSKEENDYYMYPILYKIVNDTQWSHYGPKNREPRPWSVDLILPKLKEKYGKFEDEVELDEIFPE